MKKILFILLTVFIFIQFFQINRESSQQNHHNITNVFNTSDSIKNVLILSCYDCHSNAVNYPWYSYIQPLGWWIKHHVDEGTKELNFDNFKSYSLARQKRKLEECIEQINDGVMPLESYTWVHRQAILTSTQKKILANWFKNNINQLTTTYPADSFVFKKRPRH